MSAEKPEPAYASSAALAGLAAEVDGLRRQLDPLRRLHARVEEIAALVARVADELAEHTARPKAAAVPSWLMLPTDPELADELLEGLTEWLRVVYLRYPDAAATFLECWCWHPELVEELLWLMHAWLAAYQGPAASVALVGDWHDRYRPGVVARIKRTAGACSIENHQQRPGYTPAAAPIVPLGEAAEFLAGWWATRREEPAPEPTEPHLAAVRELQRGGRR